MTKEEAITIIDNLHLIGCGRNQHENDLKINIALDMAIEALQFSKHFDLLKEYQSLQEVVQCKDCDKGFGSPVCPIQSKGWAINKDTFYCAWGERIGEVM